MEPVEGTIYEQELYINCSGIQSQSTWAITPLYDVGKNTIIATNDFSLVGVAQETPYTKLAETAPAG